MARPGVLIRVLIKGMRASGNQNAAGDCLDCMIALSVIGCAYAAIVLCPCRSRR